MAKNNHEINLEQLYRGYVLSFNSLSIPIYKEERNLSLFTHKVISYWADVGLALGYSPWCEEEKRDLGWYSYEDKKYMLHLESENQSKRIDKTLGRLCQSEEEYRVGIIFNNHDKYDEGKWKKELETTFNNKGKNLIITTWWKHIDLHSKQSGQEDLKNSEYHYRVTGHTIKGGRVESLAEAVCIWPKFGTLRMIFSEGKPNW